MKANSSSSVAEGSVKLSEKRMYQLILGALTTEKSVRAADKNDQVVFRVVNDATKPEIKAAVEKLFSVDVRSVRIVNVKGKIKQFKQREGRRSDWKKAYVSLEKGQDIKLADYAQGV